jgi:cytidylate kinase
MVAKTLGWECMDRQLLDFMAEKYNLPHGALEVVDERKGNWLRDLFGYWLEMTAVPQTQYVAHLGQMVLMAARHAAAVFVGRGVQFVLPREKGLAIRVIAPLKHRIQRTMELRSLDHEQARQLVAETDEGRRDFVKRYFHHDVADPRLYDLVINLEHSDLTDATELVVGACRRRLATS